MLMREGYIETEKQMSERMLREAQEKFDRVMKQYEEEGRDGGY